MTQVKVKWIGKEQFVGTDSTKHSLVMSTQDEENGIGLKPSELLLLSLGGCTGVDIVSILTKKRQRLTDLEIDLTAEQDPGPPWTFRKIHLEYTLHGRGLSAAAVERAIKLSEKKYCPVSATVAGVAELTSSFRVVDDEG